MEAEKEKETRHINRTVAMIRKKPKNVEPTYTTKLTTRRFLNTNTRKQTNKDMHWH